MILPPLTKGMIIECTSTINKAWLKGKSYNVLHGAIHDEFGNRWIADMNPEMEFKVKYCELPIQETVVIEAIKAYKAEDIRDNLHVRNIKDNYYVTTGMYNSMVKLMSSNFGKHKGDNMKTKKQPQPKPVYTQEMKDKGDVPCVGMMVDFYNDECEVLLGKDVDGNYILISEGCYLIADAAELSPITPPTPLIDGECYQFEYINKERRGYYENKNERIVFLNGWARCSACTNIRPLVLGE